MKASISPKKTEPIKIDVFQKTLPQNMEAEQAVLGGILIDNEAIHQVLEIIEVEDFYKESHRKIFLVFLELYEQNQPIDLVTVCESLQKKEQLEEVGGATFLASLVEVIPTASNIAYYAKIVKEKSILRKLINRATYIINQCVAPTDENIEEILDKAEQSIFEISEQRIQTSYYPLKELIKSTFQTIQSITQKDNSHRFY